MLISVPDSLAGWISEIHIVNEDKYDPEEREVPVLCGNRSCWQKWPYYSCKVVEHKVGDNYGTLAWVGDVRPSIPFCKQCLKELEMKNKKDENTVTLDLDLITICLAYMLKEIESGDSPEWSNKELQERLKKELEKLKQ